MSIISIEQFTNITIVNIWLIIINLISCTVMGIDKFLARKQKNRIPENKLMILGIIGGAFGLLIAMRIFRHKTKHYKFIIGVPVLILVNFIMYILPLYYL